MTNASRTIIDNDYSKVELENGIIITTWKQPLVNLEIIKQIVHNRTQAAGGKKYPLLVKVKSLRSSTKEARDFLASEKGRENVISTAIHVTSIMEHMIASLFIYLNKPVIPTKIFKDEARAKEWLAQFVIHEN
jgi:hypothetical protein